MTGLNENNFNGIDLDTVQMVYSLSLHQAMLFSMLLRDNVVTAYDIEQFSGTLPRVLIGRLRDKLGLEKNIRIRNLPRRGYYIPHDQKQAILARLYAHGHTD